jgi:hypothetical protein
LKIEIENTLKTKKIRKALSESLSLYWNIEQNLCFFLIVPFYKKLCYGI